MTGALPSFDRAEGAAVYADLKTYLTGLLDPALPAVTNLANFCAAVKTALPKASWAGFYLFDGMELFLGPFQGKPACTAIAVGRGVCGKAAEDLRTVIVPDVHAFPGHIACDEGSNSEIVIPLVREERLLGVLDLDSYSFNAFDETDRGHLEDLVTFLVKSILPSHFPLIS